VVADCSPDDLKNLSQMILSDIKEGSVVLGSSFEGKANVIAAGSKQAVAAGFNAGNVIRELAAALDGKGGGRPELAMGSGKAVEKLQSVLG
jgi:alanyl-tRNA synthetase